MDLDSQHIQSQKSTQKRVIVTGGSSGIGLAICNRLSEKGFQVFNLDLRPPTGIDSDQLVSDKMNPEAAVGAQHVMCDVRQHSQVVDAVTQIASKGGISALICNAGAHLSANIEQTSEQTFIDLFELNVKGAFSATQTVLPFMKERGGSIVYIASEQAVVAKPNSFAYNLSKHALASMAKTTALDYAQYGIRANAVCPGTIDTPLYQKAISAYCERSGADEAQVHKEEAAMQPLGRIGQANEVAAMVDYLLSDEASFVTGSLQMIDGGYCVR